MFYLNDLAASRENLVRYATHQLQTMLETSTQLAALMGQIMEDSLEYAVRFPKNLTSGKPEDALAITACLWPTPFFLHAHWTDKAQQILAEMQKAYIRHGNSHISALDCLIDRSFAHMESQLPGEAIPAAEMVRATFKEAESAALHLNAITTQTVDISAQETQALTQYLTAGSKPAKKTPLRRTKRETP